MTVEPGPAPELSVTIVCCDNDRTIGRTLDSVRGLAGEIVAVDSGSTDGTIPLLEAAGARIVAQPWLGYVKQKQLALEQARGRWVLHLDSDESLDAELAAAVRAAVERDDPAVGGYACNRRLHFAGRPLMHAFQPEWRLRLVRRDAGRWTGIDPHDAMAVDRGRVRRLPGTMRHDAFDSVADALARQVAHGRTSARALHARGRRGSAWRVATAPPLAFLKQAVLRRGILDGWRGIVMASVAAAAAMAKHAVLLELTHRREESGDAGAPAAPPTAAAAAERPAPDASPAGSDRADRPGRPDRPDRPVAGPHA